MVRYSALTDRAWGARLIVWPESALPVLANTIEVYLRDLQAKGRGHGADFAIGLVNYLPDTNEIRQRIVGVERVWRQLVLQTPLGAVRRILSRAGFVRSWMRLMSLPYDSISPGPKHQSAQSAAGQKLGVTICYEDAFGSDQLGVLREATLLINVTNNAWYGNSTAPHQHLQISRMRALEAGRYLVRAANDGITAAIGPHGEIVARLPQFQEGVLRADVQPMTGLTPYARFGNYPVVLGAGALLGFAAWRRRRGG